MNYSFTSWKYRFIRLSIHSYAPCGAHAAALDFVACVFVVCGWRHCGIIKERQGDN